MNNLIHIQKIAYEPVSLAEIAGAHPGYLLLLAQNRSGQLQLHYKSYPIKANRIFIFPALTPKLQLDWAGGGWLIRCEDRHLRAFFRKYPEERLLPLFRPTKKPFADLMPATAAAVRALAQIIYLESRNSNNARIMQSYLDALILHLCNAFRLSNKFPVKQPNFAVAEKLLALIREQFKTERQPIFYAQSLGVPVRKLNEISKAATGRTVIELITDDLLTEAERLLVENHLSIKEIAYELDFADMAQFSHFISRHTGQSPKDFRQQVQADK